MTDQNRSNGTTDDDNDDRSDIQQAVEARADAVARGEGGTTFDGEVGESGADGVVRNQGDDAQ